MEGNDSDREAEGQGPGLEALPEPIESPAAEPDAAALPPRVNRRLAILAAVAIFVLAGGYFIIRKTLPFMFADSKTYDIYWNVPPGWSIEPKTPFTLFLYKHPKRGVFIRGFQYHVESEVNVSPNLDADGLADYYLTTTRENQANWQGKQVDGIKIDGLYMTIIRRETSGKVVYTAFGNKGNTTFGAALYGGGKDAPLVDETLGEFREFLKSFALKPAIGPARGYEQKALASSSGQ